MAASVAPPLPPRSATLAFTCLAGIALLCIAQTAAANPINPTDPQSVQDFASTFVGNPTKINVDIIAPPLPAIPLPDGLTDGTPLKDGVTVCIPLSIAQACVNVSVEPCAGYTANSFPRVDRTHPIFYVEEGVPNGPGAYAGVSELC